MLNNIQDSVYDDNDDDIYLTAIGCIPGGSGSLSLLC